MIAWLYLLLAGFFEVILAIGLKYCEGFTKFWPSMMTLLATVVSFYSLSQAVKFLPIGLAYAVWTGIGAVGVTIVGITFLEESLSLIKVFCILLITLGIVGLKFA